MPLPHPKILIPWIVSMILIISLVLTLMRPAQDPRGLGISGNISYFWDFGDGTTAIGENPDHRYQQSGNYTITLIVTNGTGSISKTFNISAGEETTLFAVSPISDVIFESADTCSDGIDNDGNGLIDSDDTGCYLTELCNDGIDNDLDRLVDYSDPDCFQRELGDKCFNNMDDDRDGLADCWDQDCRCADKGLSPEDVCHTNCKDGFDNDGDGLIDCEDPGCDTACAEAE